jgi:hypothetical protein
MSEPPTAAYANKIEELALDQLRPYRGNARTHSAQQIREIARSIEHFGFTNPVLIDRNHQIIAGHGWVAAARLLGLTSVPRVICCAMPMMLRTPRRNVICARSATLKPFVAARSNRGCSPSFAMSAALNMLDAVRLPR